MAAAADHHYVLPLEGRLLCACGHAEPFSGADLSAALERMNEHIRASYTDEEWEVHMKKTKLATLDPATGDLKMSPEGPKS
jgi:hypothetical protein